MLIASVTLNFDFVFYLKSKIPPASVDINRKCPSILQKKKPKKTHVFPVYICKLCFRASALMWTEPGVWVTEFIIKNRISFQTIFIYLFGFASRLVPACLALKFDTLARLYLWNARSGFALCLARQRRHHSDAADSAEAKSASCAVKTWEETRTERWIIPHEVSLKNDQTLEMKFHFSP